MKPIYEIVIGHSIVELVRKVNDLIAQGYLPIGSLYASQGTLYQTMMLKSVN